MDKIRLQYEERLSIRLDETLIQKIEEILRKDIELEEDSIYNGSVSTFFRISALREIKRYNGRLK